MTSSLGELTSQVFNLGRLMRDRIYRGESPAAFSFIQMKALDFVSEKGSPSMKDIADNFGITPPSATDIIDRLVKTGYLKRITDGGDRRVVRLKITTKGRKNLDKGFRIAAAKIKKILAKLNEKEKSDFVKIIKKLL